MNISKIIDKGYVSVSVLEDTRQVADWLQKYDCLAVRDEERHVVGIVTLRDLHREKAYQLIDCAFYKPWAAPQQSPKEVFIIMQQNNTDYLPVYDQDDFCGTISLMAITASLLASLESLQSDLASA